MARMKKLPPLTGADDLPLDLKLAIVVALGTADAIGGPAWYHPALHLRSVDRAIRRSPGREWIAVETDLLYAVEGLHHWRGDHARSVKRVFRAYITASRAARGVLPGA